jgi:peptidoglycan/xylan/chitin deacetylase (PgdA/CDA1 family)
MTHPVPVLLWHGIGPAEGAAADPFRVDASTFERQLDLVVDSGRTPLTATELAQAIAGRRPLPASPVVLTFDDGFADLAAGSVAAMLERSLRGTAFVTTGYLGRPGYLDVAGLRSIAGPDVEIGAHSVSHPHLDLLDAADARREITGSRYQLEDLVARPVTSFAYPHGSHSARTRDLVAGAGYLTAHAVKNALSHGEDDVFAVARYAVRSDTTDTQFSALLAGRGAPLAWRGERWRTKGYRLLRRWRYGRRPPELSDAVQEVAA